MFRFSRWSSRDNCSSDEVLECGRKSSPNITIGNSKPLALCAVERTISISKKYFKYI